jgi:hypothetical protein
LISTDPKDLFVLTADKDAQFAVEELLRRGEALQIRQITFDCVVHADHDGGVRKRAHEFLRTFLI